MESLVNREYEGVFFGDSLPPALEGPNELRLLILMLRREERPRKL